MPERPLLILPVPGQPVQRRNKSGGGEKAHQPTRQRQAQRIGPRLTMLQEAFEARSARLRAEATGIIPEEVLVLETVGPVDDFIVAVRNIQGMEWLGEVEEEDIPPDDDFFALDSEGQPKPGKLLLGRIFLVFSNQQALNQMLSLWRRWQNGEVLPQGLRKWEELFTKLREIRPWGVRDRLLETGVLDDWNERIAHNAEVVPCEIELWYRQNLPARTAARDRVVALVASQQGRVLHQAIIEEIEYHALLVQLPVSAVQGIIRGAYQDVALVQCEKIRFFRATGQMAGIVDDGERTPDLTPIEVPRTPSRDPVIALLDGLPLQNHRRLAGRLIVDDPDNFEPSYQTQDRRHGTAMASLILHGELDANEDVLKRSLYIRPILQPDNRDWLTPRREVVPENILVVDLIHRAVRRLFEGEGGNPPVAPSVSVVNISIGIIDRLFDGSLSPLAKLIDWLAWRYKVLFIVSAGNHLRQIELNVARDEFARMNPNEVQAEALRTIAADARHRRLLSPAEGVNVLTIGAIHKDHSRGNNVPRSIDPYLDEGLPSPINAQGMGYRRSIKPEIMVPGGRVVFHEHTPSSQNVTLATYSGILAPGQRVAAPGTTPGDTSASWYIRGTSNATALTSRAAAILYDVLQDLRRDPGGDLINEVPLAVWLKALLVHATEWGMAGKVLEGILKTPENSRQFKEYLTRLLGYGALDTSSVAECTVRRVTALGGGSLGADQSHVHRFPLPPSLSGRRGWRRLKITLAWLTPVNPSHRDWRKAAMWFNPPTDPLRLARQQADWRAVQRGTVQHEILEGERAAAFVDGDNLEIQVSCRPEAGVLEEAAPYALAITLEVGQEVEVIIYDEIRVRIHERVRVTPP